MRKFRQPMSDTLASHGVLGAIQPFEVWNGGDGNDTHTGTSSDDTLNGNGGNDTLNGGDGSDLIDGGEGNDFLAGDAGDDVLHGGIGDDTITSTSGADEIDGGDGADKWIGSYASATTAFTFDQRIGALSNGTTLTGIESIQLNTGSGADQFTMTGEQVFTIDGGAGSDAFIFDPAASSHSATPLTVVISDKRHILGVTIRAGDGTNRVSQVEHLTIIGSSADDTFQVGAAKYAKDGFSFAIDGGGGYDGLTWESERYSPTTFIVHQDGTVESSVGTVANFEYYNMVLGYGPNNVALGDGDDVVTTPGGGTIKGGGGDDEIRGGSLVYGEDGNDTLSTGGDRAEVFGGDGDDVLSASGEDIMVDGGLGYDQWTSVLDRDVGFDQATGTFTNGTVVKNVEKISFTTSIYGEGSDISISSDSELSIVSKSWKDLVSVDFNKIGSPIHLTASVDGSGVGHLDFGQVHISSYPTSHFYARTVFVPSAFDDTFLLADVESGRLLPALDGGAGIDTLGFHLPAGSQFVVAEDGSVTTTYGHYTNFERFDLTAHEGDNVVALAGGDDTITVLATATGTNDLSGGGGADVITGALGTDTIRGGDGDDTLTGSDGDDLLNGGLGDDVIVGGAGVDSVGYDGATAGVTVSLLKVGVAQDTKGAGIDTLTGIENLYGTEFKDKLIGDAFANLLRGREGDDLLKGGAGDDRLEGGPGADRMAGGKGADTFAFLKLTDISLGAPDRITDFRHADADKIELSNIDLSKDAGDQFFTFIGTSAFSGRTDIFELRVEDVGNKTFLVQGDVNHDGVADFTFDVKTDAPLVANDFVL